MAHSPPSRARLRLPPVHASTPLRWPYIQPVFDNQLTNEISQIRIVPTNHNNPEDDILRWKPAKNGVCTTKEIYKYLYNQNIIQLPDAGSRSISPQAKSILHKVWKAPKMPPLIETFAWRLIRRALATGDRAARYTKNININQNCNSCGQIENDAHLFFHCHLPKAVWFSSSPALITDNLPIEDDGVQEILTSFIDDSTPDDLLSKFFITLWFL